MKRIKDGDHYLVELELESQGETEFAYRFTDGTKVVWFPKSQIVDMVPAHGNEMYTVVIPEWLATEKELV